MRNLQRIQWTVGLFGLAATTSLTINPQAATANPSAKCENGTLLGSFAIRAAANGKFVRPRDGKLKAVANQAPTQADEATVFQMYDISKLPGGAPGTFAARSAQNPSKWWRVKSNSPFVKLDDDCKAHKTSYQFRRSSGQGGNYTIQSKKDNKWIKVDGDKKLKASSNNANGNNKQFAFARIGQPTNEPPRPNTPSNIHGWWRGNNGNLYGIYQAPRSANINGTIYDNSGTPFEDFDGSISGNTISARWRNLCTNARGSRSGLINGNAIQWTAGQQRDTQLQKLNNEPAVQRHSACYQPQPTTLTGWWTTQGRGSWWLGRQTGNNVTLTKFADGNNGKPQIQFTGSLDSEGKSNGILRQCGEPAGSNYTLQRRTNNLYYFGGNNQTISRSNTAPPFRTDTGATCARESSNINGWWWDQQRRFWKAEQNNDNVTLTRYRQSDGKPYSVFTGTKRNRSGTALYAYGLLKECHTFSNKPNSFSLNNGKLVSETGNIQLSKYIGQLPFTPRTGCDPAAAATAGQSQLLTLQKTITLMDKEISVYHEEATKTIGPKQITVSRPTSGRIALSKFVGWSQSGCRTHGFYVDEVTYDEWDQVQVDSQGVASFYNNVALLESDDPLTGSGCPPLAWGIGRYYTISSGNDAAPSVFDLDVPPNSYSRHLRQGPFLSVSPGDTKSRTLTINKPDGKIVIVYTLSNHTQRIRPRDN